MQSNDRLRTDGGEPEDVEACPDCGVAGCLISRSPRSGGDSLRSGDPEAACRCTDCGATFDEPDRRPPEHPPGRPSGLAGELARIGEDDDRELIPDGGQRLVEACPECDGTGLKNVVGHQEFEGRASGHDVFCEDCGAHLDADALVERPAHHEGGRPGLAGELAAIGEDEDLMTDGGEPEDVEDWQPSCYDCEREFARRNLQPTPVHVHHDDGGYDRIEVPMCHACRLRRFGHDCPNCGATWETIEDADACCGGPGPDGEVHATDGGEPVPEGYRPGPRDRSTPAGAIPVECDWCPRPLPDAGAHRVETFSPDGDMLGIDWLCADCRRYGPPESSRRERREYAERLTTNMSRLERAAWWVIGWVRS